MGITVVGANSFLAAGLRSDHACVDWRFLSHREACDADIESDTVINFAFDPYLVSNTYDVSHDVDAILARKNPARYVMLSSRMIYGPWNGGCPILETDALNPQNVYGENKAVIEGNLQEILGDRLCILRLANVFGNEAGRKTFFGVALQSLRASGVISFDIPRESVRDILPVAAFHDTLKRIAGNFQPGIFNIGSGQAVQCGEITDWLIEGYESGKADFTGDVRKGDFLLDVTKAMKIFDLPSVGFDVLRAACIACGRNIKNV